jgi:hypothetical protein
MASNIVDFPLSPAPTKQFSPGDGSHFSDLIPRKLLISTTLILATANEPFALYCYHRLLDHSSLYLGETQDDNEV